MNDVNQRSGVATSGTAFGRAASMDWEYAFYLSSYGNGNVSEYIHASYGSNVAHYEYGPFGEQTVATGSLSTAFRHRFSTKPLDEETGYYYYGYRSYDPLTGRWMGRDPIGERGGVNIYGMLGNSLVSKIDLLGFHTVTKVVPHRTNKPITDISFETRAETRECGCWDVKYKITQEGYSEDSWDTITEKLDNDLSDGADYILGIGAGMAATGGLAMATGVLAPAGVGLEAAAGVFAFFGGITKAVGALIGDQFNTYDTEHNVTKSYHNKSEDEMSAVQTSPFPCHATD
jgi:RHS repeat-associated protein